MIESIGVSGLLSFGWQQMTLPLRRLNVIIGPNGSGKSNLLDLFDLLRAVPKDLNDPVDRKGRAASWMHKAKKVAPDAPAMLEVVLLDPALQRPLRYRLGFGSVLPELPVMNLVSEQLQTRDEHTNETPFGFLEGQKDSATIKAFSDGGVERDEVFGAYTWLPAQHFFPPQPLFPRRSLLSHARGNPACPQIGRVAQLLEGINLHQGWQFGPQAPVRQIQPAGLPGMTLLPDASNLGLVLHRLRLNDGVRQRIRDSLRSLYYGVDDIEVSIEPQGVKMYLTELDMSTPTPASRMSDGTLRWLALLSILLDPEPPPLVCLEEPELGLHPRVISTLGQLLIEASERTQIIVTTHSDALVSEFSGSPEDVVVCERPFGATELVRLEPDRLRHWLEEYSLGHVWMSGELGGM